MLQTVPAPQVMQQVLEQIENLERTFRENARTVREQ